MKIHARVGAHTWNIDRNAIPQLVDGLRELGYSGITEQNWWRRMHGLGAERGQAVIGQLVIVMHGKDRYDQNLVTTLVEMRDAQARNFDRWTVLS